MARIPNNITYFAQAAQTQCGGKNFVEGRGAYKNNELSAYCL
jgi:hypothetical protein